MDMNLALRARSPDVGSDVSMKIGYVHIFDDVFRPLYRKTLGERTDRAVETDHLGQESAPGPMATTK